MATIESMDGTVLSSNLSVEAPLVNSSSPSSIPEENRSTSTQSGACSNGASADREQLQQLDRELLSFITRVIPSVEDTMSHKVVLDLVRDAARRVLDPSADIQMFGSAASGLCERGSDIDATVIVDFAILNKRFHGKNRMPSVGHETRTLCSEAVCAIAKYIEGSNGTGLAVEGLISGAKVPIVVLSSFGRQIIDVSINNVLPTFNTRLLGEYAKLDRRVVALVLCVKRWAKMAQVSDAKMGNLSSYSWSILCLYYLQYVRIIPSLQARAPPGAELYHCPSTGKSFDVGYVSGANALSEVRILRDSLTPAELAGSETVAELLCGFFTFYDSEFKWGREVVSIRIGGIVRKTISDPEFGVLSQGSRSMVELPAGIDKIHIEDPFDLSRNLHCVMDTDGLVRLRKAFGDIAAKLSGAPVLVLASLAKTLMSYKNVVPAFATAELHKRYNGVGVRGAAAAAPAATQPPPAQQQSQPIPQQQQQLGGPNNYQSMGPSSSSSVQFTGEHAAAIVRNYTRQQEILQKQLMSIQQKSAAASNVRAPLNRMAAAPAGVGCVQPGRGSYKQSIVSSGAVATEWATVDLW